MARLERSVLQEALVTTLIDWRMTATDEAERQVAGLLLLAALDATRTSS